MLKMKRVMSLRLILVRLTWRFAETTQKEERTSEQDIIVIIQAAKLKRDFGAVAIGRLEDLSLII